MSIHVISTIFDELVVKYLPQSLVRILKMKLKVVFV